MSKQIDALLNSTSALTAYLYIRYSTDEQGSGDSARRQLALGTEYAAKNGLLLPKEHILEDFGISAFRGANIKTGKLGQFMKMLAGGEIKPGTILLVEDIDRLSRQTPVDAVFQFYDLLQKGVKIVTLRDGRIYEKSTTDLGSLVTSFVTISRANEESNIKSMRGAQAWKRKRERAKEKKLTKACPKWVKPDENLTAFHLIPERAAVVKQIIDWSLAGIGIDATATRLNRDKIPTFGRSTGWEKSTITNILTSPAIFGVYQPHTKHKEIKRRPAGDPVPDYFPAIIDEQTYLRIQKGRKSRRILGMGRKGNSYSNLFTKIAVCGECGQPMLFEKKGQPPRSYKYFYCRGYRRQKCDAKPWRYDLFERAFLTHVKDLDFSSLFANGVSEVEQLRQLIETKNDELRTIDLKMRGLTDLFADPAHADSKHISTRLLELESQAREVGQSKVNLLRRCDELHAQAQAASDTDHMKLLLDLNKAEGDQFLKRSKIAQRIRDLVEEIRVFPPTKDRTIILNWANKRVTEIELSSDTSGSKKVEPPMFEVGLSDGKKKRFLLNYSPGNNDSADLNLINKNN